MKFLVTIVGPILRAMRDDPQNQGNETRHDQQNAIEQQHECIRDWRHSVTFLD